MKALVMSLFLIVPLTVGCSEQPSSQVAEQQLTPERLGEIGSEIGANPESAETILADAGMTFQQFEQEVRRVTEDPELSRRYASAYHAER